MPIGQRWRRAASIAGFGGGLLLVMSGTAQQANEVMGAVATRDARVTGGLKVEGEVARL